MPALKIKVKGDKRVTIDSNWETHIVDGTLNPMFSGSLDGFNITQWRLNFFDAAIIFRKNGIDLVDGDYFSINDINNGLVYVEYIHGVSSSGSCNFTLTGEAEYKIGLTIYSII